MPCLGLLEDAELKRGLWVVSVMSPCKVSLTCPQRRLCSSLSSDSPPFAGALANIIFMVVPLKLGFTGSLISRYWAQGVFHQAPCSSQLQTLSPSPQGLPGLVAGVVVGDIWGCFTSEGGDVPCPGL